MLEPFARYVGSLARSGSTSAKGQEIINNGIALFACTAGFQSVLEHINVFIPE